ncbi:heme-copper oxidase subunit III [Haloarcula sp. S1CR25-12]|uniref:Heme-copper oxidase subunit III n=1 Tax=Haloarcula saliterrae TaxID=2950534 RepID=A0ABU2FB49_9EURY|nr:heme-copper oxidase subunit III [Haloarcula sp. S1CR25-12]MDS0258935.1 heme-copper oxidase subunit III [Haloarcula sp. S1CR25-12]
MSGWLSTGGGHAEDGGEEHDHSSYWPLIAAVGAGMLYLGAGFFFVGLDLVPAVLPIGLAGAGVVGLLTGLFGWAYEAFMAPASGHGGSADVYTTTMILFLVSDVATFSAGFIYFAFIRSAAFWPPDHLPPLLGSLVAINTTLLVASSVTIHYSHEALVEGDQRKFLGLLGATLGLGVLFLGGQIFEYYELLVVDGFSLSTGVLGSAFYGLTGLHGLHVALGVLLIAIAFGRSLRGEYGPQHDTAIRTTSLYWHFVDAVWLFLVVVLYVGATI